MAKNIVRPAAVPKQMTLALGFYLFFTPPSSNTNLLDGLRMRNWSTSGVTFNMIDNNDQSSLDVFTRQVSTTADPGTATSNVYYDPRKGMPTVADKLQTIWEGTYGKVTIAVNDQGAAATAPLLVWMECDAVLQSYANITANYGEILFTDYVFKLCGKPEFETISMTGMTQLSGEVVIPHTGGVYAPPTEGVYAPPTEIAIPV